MWRDRPRARDAIPRLPVEPARSDRSGSVATVDLSPAASARLPARNTTSAPPTSHPPQPTGAAVDLLAAERLLEFGRRHHLVGIVGGDPMDQLALLDFAGTITAKPERSRNTSSLRSSRRSAFLAFWSGPWQAKQCSDRIGRISRSKSTGRPACAWFAPCAPNIQLACDQDDADPLASLVQRSHLPAASASRRTEQISQRIHYTHSNRVNTYVASPRRTDSTRRRYIRRPRLGERDAITPAAPARPWPW